MESFKLLNVTSLRIFPRYLELWLIGQVSRDDYASRYELSP